MNMVYDLGSNADGFRLMPRQMPVRKKRYDVLASRRDADPPEQDQEVARFLSRNVEDLSG